MSENLTEPPAESSDSVPAETKPKTTRKAATKKASAKKATAKKKSATKRASKPKSAAPEAKEQQESLPGMETEGEKSRPPREERSSQKEGSQREDASEEGSPKGKRSRPPRNRKDRKPREPREQEERDSSGSGENPPESSESGDGEHEGGRRRRRRGGRNGKNGPRETPEERAARIEANRKREADILAAAPEIEVEGMVEISPKGFGFIRTKEKDYDQSPKDVFITPEVVRIHGLRDGLILKCKSKEGVRGPQLTEVISINGKEPEAYHNLPYFEELTAINPNKRLKMETTGDRLTTRVIDLLAPIGRGQRGLIVAPPRTGKTTLLHHIAEAIQENYDEEMHLMVVLIDERPEEVTDFRRSFPGVEVIASSNDSDVKNHTRVAEIAVERAKRLVEAGEHVFLLMDSITRMARAFNNSTRGGSKRGTGTGGLAVGALEIPRRLFAAARNTREAGSLTIIATALIHTNSKLDEAIFQEFKGTGNMELVLDRMLAQNYVYPAVDIHRSGTRREELLIPQHQLEKIHVIRRGLSGQRELEAMEWLIGCLRRYPSNAQMLLEIRQTAVA